MTQRRRQFRQSECARSAAFFKTVAAIGNIISDYWDSLLSINEICVARSTRNIEDFR